MFIFFNQKNIIDIDVYLAKINLLEIILVCSTNLKVKIYSCLP